MFWISPLRFLPKSVFRIRLIERSLPPGDGRVFSCDSNFGCRAGRAARLNELLQFFEEEEVEGTLVSVLNQK